MKIIPIGGDFFLHKHVLKIMVLMNFSISLVACGSSDAKTNNNLTYEDIVDLTIEKFESELPS
jgi:hypothetical protein